MVKLNKEELRKEYVSNLKSECFDYGFVGFLVFCSFIYLIYSFAIGLWKLLIIIPIVLIILVVRKLIEIDKQIKDNQQRK